MHIRKTAVAGLVAVAVALPVAPAPAQQGDQRQGSGRGDERPVPPVAPAARDALQRAWERGRLSEAQYALERARTVFDLRRVRREYGDVAAPEGRHVTMLFRDLFLRLGDLEGDERAAAENLLARPTDPGGDILQSPNGSFAVIAYGEAPVSHLCSAPGGGNPKICVHWVDDPAHQHHATAEQAALTLATLEEVWDAQVTTGGFRRPKPDHKGGPTAELDPYLDVYLADVGQHRVYGYCTSDDPSRDEPGIFDVSAYCVLDNDYQTSEFPGQPLENLQVTAAHEFFHAVQFAYDVSEDWWLMEGTAAAIEDHVYDDINDNYQFLASSQLRKPERPVDRVGNGPAFMYSYGAWIFWRFMSEYLSETGEPDLKVLRRIWARADSTPGAPDDYSIKAAKNVARSAAYRVPFRRLFADYGVALRDPERFLEGSGYVAHLKGRGLSLKKAHARATLRSGKPVARRATNVNHLANKFVVIQKNTSGDARLRLVLDAPPKKRGSIASVIRSTPSGTKVRRIPLNKQGDGRATFKFGSGTRRAVVVLTNSSTRFKNCWADRDEPPPWEVSCRGDARDDGLRYRLTARLLD